MSEVPPEFQGEVHPEFRFADKAVAQLGEHIRFCSECTMEAIRALQLVHTVKEIPESTDPHYGSMCSDGTDLLDVVYQRWQRWSEAERPWTLG